MLLSSFPHAVTIIRPTERVDGRGDTIRDFADPYRLDTRGHFQVRQTSERTETDRSIVKTTFALYLEADADVLSGDRVEVEGSTYTVEGITYSPTGVSSRGPLHVSLERVEG